jgi:hypothetical protein
MPCCYKCPISHEQWLTTLFEQEIDPVVSIHAGNNCRTQFWCLTISQVICVILSNFYVNFRLVILSNFCQTFWAVLLLSVTCCLKLSKIKEVHALTNQGIVKFMNDYFGGPHSSS